MKITYAPKGSVQCHAYQHNNIRCSNYIIPSDSKLCREHTVTKILGYNEKKTKLKVLGEKDRFMILKKAITKDKLIKFYETKRRHAKQTSERRLQWVDPSRDMKTRSSSKRSVSTTSSKQR